MLREMSRILKPDGKLILSTPQNSHGHIPIHPHHHIEHSLESLLELTEKYFVTEQVIGFKAGTIYFEDDPIGTNTMLVLNKNSSDGR